MPKTSDLLGIQVAYPDNWSLTGPVDDGDSEGFVLESPTGMFFSVNRYAGRTDAHNVLQQAAAAMDEQYDEIETSPLESDDALISEQGVEMNFYCEQLVITSRLHSIATGNDVLLVQMQAENRDFDKSKAVFEAMLKTLRDSLAG